ncbi:MAG: helix-turn-helix domain-containing protein [Defluviitaleaceae bacterium]|nr:helix-turn-helix domain-containing protein [Defluviitaleaceae bacterium]
MNKRLYELRKTLGYSQKELCKRTGISQSNYSAMETGTRELRDVYLNLICTIFGASESWLRTGNGQMFTQKRGAQIEELLNIYDNLLPEFQEFLLSQARNMLTLQNNHINPIKPN